MPEPETAFWPSWEPQEWMAEIKGEIGLDEWRKLYQSEFSTCYRSQAEIDREHRQFISRKRAIDRMNRNINRRMSKVLERII